jgi:hypothetical protein
MPRLSRTIQIGLGVLAVLMAASTVLLVVATWRARGARGGGGTPVRLDRGKLPGRASLSLPQEQRAASPTLAAARCALVTAPDSEMAVDERGGACRWEDVDSDPLGCCPSAASAAGPLEMVPLDAPATARMLASGAGGAVVEPFPSCAACVADVHCCSSFLACVACCAHPAHVRLRAEVWEHSLGHPSFRLGALALPDGTSGQHPPADAPYEAARNLTLCARRCRVWPSATVHENAFATPLRHCFGFFGPPRALPGGV